MRIHRTIACITLVLTGIAASGAAHGAVAQARRGSRSSVGVRSGEISRATSSRSVFRVTRPRSARGVPIAPEGIVRRTPVVGPDGRLMFREAFLRPFRPREAPIIEVLPGDPFGRDGFRDRGHDGFRDGRGRDRFRDGRGHDGFRDGHGRDGFGDPFGRRGRDRRLSPFGGCRGGSGLRVAVGSDGVHVGVKAGRSGFGRGGHSGCGFRRAGGFLIGPYGTVYSSGAVYGGAAAYADADAESDDGYYEENASGAAFSGDDGRYATPATGCATVIVRMRGGEFYGGEVALPALGAETPEALAAALRSRHRRGRSTVLRGFDGASLGIPAGPGIEGVQVEPCA